METSTAASQIPAFSEPSGGSAVAAPIAIKKKKPAKRRRKSMAGWLVLIGCAAAILAMIGVLVWVVMAKPGTIAITAKDGSFTLSTNPGGSADPSTAAPGKRVTSRPVDPIMGNLGPNRAEDDSGRRPLDSYMNADQRQDDAEDGPDNMQPMPSRPEPAPPMPVQPDSAQPMPVQPEPGDDTPMEMTSSDSSSDPSVTPPQTPTDGNSAAMPAESISKEMIAKAEELIAKARTAIKTADWNQLRAVHEAAADTPLSDEQKPRAEPLFEIADLTSYYRGAIERGVATLQTGSDFELTETLRVIVVEKGPDRLVIRFNATVKEYTFDELPPRLADKLATFALKEGDPTAIAAQAVYQAIAPKSTDIHRQDAIETLETFTGEVEGANPKQIAAALRDVLAP
ncbi:hypothetical protein RMSM_04509 [Rhodopirellula maiorica SM1]|uniref:Uncharacterized protein n=1 Tax=Rhodopirellula maiorica SM1 TaxID=1265738 RepID=M5RHB5_9BACT|nr:hypothetical protein RMSM_04509 [Rhodopirellula maiorica SM1]